MRPLVASDPRLGPRSMDYDQSGIATTYDEARALTPARRPRWQRLLSAHVERTAISLVVDLGCGTGRFSEMLAAELDARVIGLDPSEKMIDQARRNPATSPVVFGRVRRVEPGALLDGRYPYLEELAVRCEEHSAFKACPQAA
jgi:SAM-dependent methyltransferase